MVHALNEFSLSLLFLLKFTIKGKYVLEWPCFMYFMFSSICVSDVLETPLSYHLIICQQANCKRWLANITT